MSEENKNLEEVSDENKKVNKNKVVHIPKSKRLPTLTKKEKREQGIGKDEGRAILRYIRISPRKVRIVLNLIRNKRVEEAIGILRNTQKAASPILLKILNSAIANAVNNNGLDMDDLYIKEAYADQGPTLKRIRPRAQGRANRINKRTSHITIIVKEMK